MPQQSTEEEESDEDEEDEEKDEDEDQDEAGEEGGEENEQDVRLDTRATVKKEGTKLFSSFQDNFLISQPNPMMWPSLKSSLRDDSNEW